ncbi:hypothetical protein HDU87_007778 [Geranomyces variabilis]|uniref:DUF4211 domain-containing protein n=1 Tax=Geranomyces variabilis TaxID=109894 RepID=A0AAD5XN31_9FUNG|nr:hypothetical protein HDU87_007778 [Geranomyces variabilis]
MSSSDEDDDMVANGKGSSKGKGNGNDTDSSLEAPPLPQRSATAVRRSAVRQQTLRPFLLAPSASSSSKSTSAATTANATQRKLQRKSIVLSSSDSDSSLPSPPPRRPRLSPPTVVASSKRKRIPSPACLSSSSDSDAHASRPTKRVSGHRASPPRRTVRASSDPDLDSADDDDLYFSDTSKPPPPSAKANFRNALAKMKETRRAGIKAALPPSESEENSDSVSGTSSESDIAEFIAEEGDEIAELPQEFRLAASTLFDSFKIFIAFLIEIVLRGPDDVPRPGQASKSAESNIRAIEKRIDGYRMSLLSSEAWQPNFKDALNTYPIYKMRPTPPDAGVCDACRRTNHTAASEAVLSGPAYDAWTLASLPKSDPRSRMEKRFPRYVRFRPKSNESELAFLLGKFCAKRSQLYSKLTHWKWKFFVRVREALKAGFKDLEPYSRDDLLAYLEQKSVVDELWTQYNELLETATGWSKGG